MRIEVNVKTMDEVAAARAEAEALAAADDEIVIIVAAPVSPKPAERQERKEMR